METRWAKALPGLAALRGYRRAWLGVDALAGITVAAYLIPQVLAYAEVAGLPAVTGLWAITAALLVYAVLGSSRVLSVGPESTTALMTASAVAALGAASGGADPSQIAALLALAVAGVCLVGRIARLGFLARLLSRPLLIGYMAGICVLMIVSQLGKVTRVHVEGHGTLSQVRWFAAHLSQIHLPSLTIAAVTVLALFAFQRWLPRAPGPLIVMLAAAAAVHVFGLAGDGIRVLGPVPRGLPMPAVPSVPDLHLLTLVPAAVGIAAIGYTDNVLTARAFGAQRGEAADANAELLALGAANAAAGLLHGFPVSSSGSRTVIAHAMGARTQVYSLVAVVTVVMATYLLGPVLAAFPSAALGGVVIYAALRLVNLPEFRRIARFRGSELVLSLATAASVVVFDVLTGVAIAITLSVVDLLRRLARPHDAVLGYVPGLAGMHDVQDYPTSRPLPGLVVYRYDSPLFFANAEDLTARARAAVASAATPTLWFVLNTEANTEVDLTAVDALDALRQAITDDGIVFALARTKWELADDLERTGLLDRVGRDHVFPTLPTAVSAYGTWYEQRYGEPPWDGQDPPWILPDR